VFSPSGRQIAWRSQRKAGYEADKWEIMLADCQPDGSLTSTPRSLTEKIDLSFDEIVWRDEQRLLTTAEFRGEKPVFGITVSKPNIAEKAQGAVLYWCAIAAGLPPRPKCLQPSSNRKSSAPGFRDWTFPKPTPTYWLSLICPKLPP
jgi:hypothetical protein